MTALVRCRSSGAEIAGRFAATRAGPLGWRPVIWPGEELVAILPSAGGRCLVAMPWGLDPSVFTASLSLSARAVVHPRDLGRMGRILAGECPSSCLIVAEDFAYPSGPPGRRTRCWAGLWDHSLVAWAGVVLGGRLAGLVVPANSLVGRVSRHMPLLLDEEGQAIWLETGDPGAVARRFGTGAWYLEETDEAWSTGRALAD